MSGCKLQLKREINEKVSINVSICNSLMEMLFSYQVLHTNAVYLGVEITHAVAPVFTVFISL